MRKAVVTSFIIAIVGLIVAVGMLIVLQYYGYDHAIITAFITGIFSIAVAVITGIITAIASNKKITSSRPRVGAITNGVGNNIGNVESISNGVLKSDVGPVVDGKNITVGDTNHEQR